MGETKAMIDVRATSVTFTTASSRVEDSPGERCCWRNRTTPYCSVSACLGGCDSLYGKQVMEAHNLGGEREDLELVERPVHGHADAEARRSVLTALPCATLVTALNPVRLITWVASAKIWSLSSAGSTNGRASA